MRAVTAAPAYSGAVLLFAGRPSKQPAPKHKSASLASRGGSPATSPSCRSYTERNAGQCPLLEVKQTWLERAAKPAFDQSGRVSPRSAGPPPHQADSHFCNTTPKQFCFAVQFRGVDRRHIL